MMYFSTPFATSGDKTSIPDAAQPDGSVSYSLGFPVKYSTPTSSGGLNVPRGGFNELFYEITLALKQYQENGIPDYIAAISAGSGYAKYAMVLYSGNAYVSMVNSNTALPTDTTKWYLFSEPSTKFYTGGTSTGSANSQVLATLSPSGFSLSNNGSIVVCTAGYTNTSSATQFNINSTGLTTVKKNGLTGLVSLDVGDVVAGNTLILSVNTAGSCLVLMNPALKAITLTANTTYYVATTGNDTTGTGAVGSPWLTIQKAVNWIYQNVDSAGYTVTIQVADGTYTGAVSISGQLRGGGTLALLGNTTTPANCIISTTSSSAITITSCAIVNIAGFKIQTTTSGHGIVCFYNPTVTINGNMNFGAMASGGNHLYSLNSSTILIASSYTISGGAAAHWATKEAATLTNGSGVTVTLSGTPAFTQFASATNLSNIAIINAITFSGSATGSRYSATGNSVIDTNSGGASYFPGNSVGSTASGGQYL